jgi:hypothetical protein
VESRIREIRPFLLIFLCLVLFTSLVSILLIFTLTIFPLVIFVIGVGGAFPKGLVNWRLRLLSIGFGWVLITKDGLGQNTIDLLFSV